MMETVLVGVGEWLKLSLALLDDDDETDSWRVGIIWDNFFVIKTSKSHSATESVLRSKGRPASGAGRRDGEGRLPLPHLQTAVVTAPTVGHEGKADLGSFQKMLRLHHISLHVLTRRRDHPTQLFI